MATPLARAVSILNVAELEVRALVEETASKGNYDEALSLVQLARSLYTMAGGLSLALHAPAIDEPPAAGDTGRSRTAQGRGTRRGYPRFFVRGEDLVKVGWSKSNDGEYEHRSPRATVLSLAHSLEAVAGKEFSVDEILPQTGRDGAEIPVYQVYLCLAWLRDIGVVKRHGRQGYSIASNLNIVKAVDKSWQQLPTRSHAGPGANNEAGV
jgi:hypothetical protein